MPVVIRTILILILIPFLFIGTSRAHELPGGLLLHLPFDGSLENRGSMPGNGELIGKGGESAGSGPDFREGRFGQSLYFSGEEAVRIPFDLSLEFYPQVTITAWIYPEDEAHGYLFSNRSASGPSITVSNTGVQARGPDSQPGESGIIRPGRWTFVAGVWDTQSKTLQLHTGRRSKSAEMSNRVRTGAMDVWVGSYDDSLIGAVENIRIDDVRIYDHALTPEEMEGLWLDGRLGTTPAQASGTSGTTTGSAVADTVAMPTGPSGSIGSTVGSVTTDADSIEAARTDSSTDSLGSANETLQGQTPSLGTTGRVTTGADELMAAREEAAASGTESEATSATESGSSDETRTTRQELTPAGGWRISTTDFYESDVSGTTGSVKRLLEPANGGALTMVGWGLKNKLPCRLFVESQGGGRVEAGTCAGGSYNNTREAELSRAYVTALQTSPRAMNDALDSIRISGHELDETGRRTLEEGDESVDPDAPGMLAVPGRKISCREGYVASGVGGYFDRKNNDNTRLVGLSLLCRKVEPIEN